MTTDPINPNPNWTELEGKIRVLRELHKTHTEANITSAKSKGVYVVCKRELTLKTYDSVNRKQIKLLCMEYYDGTKYQQNRLDTLNNPAGLTWSPKHDCFHITDIIGTGQNALKVEVNDKVASYYQINFSSGSIIMDGVNHNPVNYPGLINQFYIKSYIYNTQVQGSTVKKPTLLNSITYSNYISGKEDIKKAFADLSSKQLYDSSHQYYIQVLAESCRSILVEKAFYTLFNGLDDEFPKDVVQGLMLVYTNYSAIFKAARPGADIDSNPNWTPLTIADHNTWGNSNLRTNQEKSDLKALILYAKEK